MWLTEAWSNSHRRWAGSADDGRDIALEVLNHRYVREKQRNGFVDHVFLFGEHIHEQGGVADVVKTLRDKIIARTMPAAAAAMGEQHDSLSALGHHQHAFQLNSVSRNLYQPTEMVFWRR